MRAELSEITSHPSFIEVISVRHVASDDNVINTLALGRWRSLGREFTLWAPWEKGPGYSVENRHLWSLFRFQFCCYGKML